MLSILRSTSPDLSCSEDSLHVIPATLKNCFIVSYLNFCPLFWNLQCDVYRTALHFFRFLAIIANVTYHIGYFVVIFTNLCNKPVIYLLLFSCNLLSRPFMSHSNVFHLPRDRLHHHRALLFHAQDGISLSLFVFAVYRNLQIFWLS